MTETPLQQTIRLSGQWPALAEVADATALPSAVLQEAALKGAVWLRAAQGDQNYRKPRRVRALNETYQSRDEILLNYDAAVLAEVAPLPVLMSDQVNYSVWYKPAGVLSQGTKWGDHCSMCYLVEQVHGKPALLVHRLDRAASGLMIMAHTKNALRKLTECFAARKVGKTYQVRVHGEFNAKLPKEITTQVADKPALTTILDATAVDSSRQADKSATDGSGPSPCQPETLLTVSIATGRKHQIRSHLASIGHPVVGDRLFDPQRAHHCDLQLVSVGVELKCPFTEKTVAVRLPDNLNSVLPQV